MAEDPTVYEYDEVYDKIEDERKKTAAAKLGTGKNKPKYITSLKKAAEQRQREYERVIERKVTNKLCTIFNSHRYHQKRVNDGYDIYLQNSVIHFIS